MRRKDLGKLVKMVDDAHAEFIARLRSETAGTDRTIHEGRLYSHLKNVHNHAVDDVVVFNPLRLLQTRLLAHLYLYLYT